MQFGTNVLGHFALTGLLLPALERSENPRVVTLASIAHKRGRLNFDDLQSTKSYSPMGSYQQSKLADLMFAFELDRRLRATYLTRDEHRRASRRGAYETLWRRAIISAVQKTLSAR